MTSCSVWTTRVPSPTMVWTPSPWPAFRDAQKTTAVVVGPRGSGKTMGARHHAHACGFDVVEDVLESAEVEGHVRELCQGHRTAIAAVGG